MGNWRIDSKIKSTVKPVHNGHPQDQKKWPFDRGALIKVRLILAVTELYWSLLTGGYCSEVAVSSGLTVECRHLSEKIWVVCYRIQVDSFHT
jgi:hypothetical protein